MNILVNWLIRTSTFRLQSVFMACAEWTFVPHPLKTIWQQSLFGRKWLLSLTINFVWMEVIQSENVHSVNPEPKT